MNIWSFFMEKKILNDNEDFMDFLWWRKIGEWLGRVVYLFLWRRDGDFNLKFMFWIYVWFKKEFLVVFYVLEMRVILFYFCCCGNEIILMEKNYYNKVEIEMERLFNRICLVNEMGYCFCRGCCFFRFLKFCFCY